MISDRMIWGFDCMHLSSDLTRQIFFFFSTSSIQHSLSVTPRSTHPRVAVRLQRWRLEKQV